jgi:glycosyltransferase involved in cell wall biosynthesis
VEKHVMEISKVLVKQGHEVTVVTEELDSRVRGNDNVGGKEIVNGISVYRISTGSNDWFRKFRIWGEMWRLRKLVENADVVHCHDVFFWYLPFRFLFPNKPVYTTFHGYESYPIKKGAVMVRRISEKLSLGNICVGDFIPKWYGTKASYVSYGAIEVKSHQVSESSSSKAHEDFGFYDLKTKASAVFIGRLDEQTGAPVYAKAVELLQKKYPKFDLVFVGDGKDRKKIEKKFRVLGFQKDPEKYLPQYHFAFVSRYLSILEAFAAKRLVFAVYDNPVKEDYLRLAPFAKWIVIAKDEKELSEMIAYYLTNPAKEKKLVASAYQWVHNQTWYTVVGLYNKLYTKHE